MEPKATCSLCGKSRRPVCRDVKVPGEGAVLVTYWICGKCDAPAPARPVASS